MKDLFGYEITVEEYLREPTPKPFKIRHNYRETTSISECCDNCEYCSYSYNYDRNKIKLTCQRTDEWFATQSDYVCDKFEENEDCY